jgi:hypothetical protein
MSPTVATVAIVVTLAALGASSAARAQMDLAGMWAQRFHEELPERGAGPEIRTRPTTHREGRRVCASGGR